MNNDISNISSSMEKRYTDRYIEMGRNIKTLGWGSTEQQQYRFDQTLQVGVDLHNKTILDIGCGFGDYYHFLKHKNIQFSSYTGYDLTPNLVKEADLETKECVDCNFYVQNILNISREQTFDVGIMLGLCNVNLIDIIDNYKYAAEVLKNAFDRVDVLIVDFLSNKLDMSYPEESFVFYYNPSKILEVGLELTPYAVLNHDYKPIPQKEFMLILKNNEGI